MCYHFAKMPLLLLGCTLACLFWGCSNSELANLPNEEESVAEWEYPIIIQDTEDSTKPEDAIERIDAQIENHAETSSSQSVSSSQAENSSLSSKTVADLPIDDTEYPYAGIPRIVIETENYREIRDRETEIPAKLQVWGENAPESEIMDLAIRGRGNSSWTNMPKKSYKIEFVNKQPILGLPKDKDWALIANYADKTLMKNYLIYQSSQGLLTNDAPKCRFTELYINNEYLGVYLLTETIKFSKNRLKQTDHDDLFLIEFDAKYKETDQYIHSEKSDYTYTIHYPKNLSENVQNKVLEQIDSLDDFINYGDINDTNLFNEKIDIKDYFNHYWIQEFSKNPDAAFWTSVYFTWNLKDPLKMGPVWDFDLAFGGHMDEAIRSPQNWHVKHSHWNKTIFRKVNLKKIAYDSYLENRPRFISLLDSIDRTKDILSEAAKNNFKRWDILSSTDNKWHQKGYDSYDEAVLDLKQWIAERIKWIDAQEIQ